jgi:pimeloyl-ACP methyl ester carboxylesterase
MLGDLLCADRFGAIDRPGEIRIPTLIILGAEDVTAPVKYDQCMKDRITGSELVIIPGAGHDVAIEKPDEVNLAIAWWKAGLG